MMHPRSQPRRGMILMVVLAMLTLFALVGVTFVLVANSQETTARIYRESETRFKPDVDPEAALAMFLGQMLYDLNDDSQGARSALRGHSLARNMYGWWNGTNPGTPDVPGVMQLNDKPFNGTGRLPNPAPFNRTDLHLQNYQYFAADNFVRDPERPQTRGNPNAPVANWFTGGFNPPYTYPDHNHFYLAQVDSNTGEVLIPSFHREYLWQTAGNTGKLNEPTNPNWTSPEGKYLTLRPTNAHHPAFPKPADPNGDVKNLDGAPGGADSIWIDIGAPVMTSADGRKYKMLVAPLIMDLDNRINLNVVGNWMGTGAMAEEHRSHQGYGPWEINPSKVLSAGNEWLNIFGGSAQKSQSTGWTRIRGRYDQNENRGVQGRTLGGGSGLRSWSQIDFNGRDDGSKGQPSPMTFPTPADGAIFGFPIYPNSTFGNGGNTENTQDHAACFNTQRPTGSNRIFPLKDMVQILRHGGTGYEMLSSDLMRLLPNNLGIGPDTARRRQMVTLLSADLDRPGVKPYIWDASSADSSLRLLGNTGANPPTLVGQQPITFPDLSSRPNPSPQGSEFANNTWRSNLASLGRLDLARISGLPSHVTNPTEAVSARQKMAEDIFQVLCRATGAKWESPGPGQFSVATVMSTPNGPDAQAVLYLAQLTANIIDFFDVDDVMTTFKLPGTTIYVYGFESPRLVINEVYAQYDNHKPDVEEVMMKKRVKGMGTYTMNLWVELMNPTPQDTVNATLPKVSGQPNGVDPKTAADCVADLSKYRLRMLDHRAALAFRNASNWNGDPDYNKGGDPSRVLADDNGEKVMVGGDWGSLKVWPMPDAQRFNDGGSMAPDKLGFAVIGPAGIQWEDTNRDKPAFNPVPTMETNKLSWSYKAADFEDPDKVKIRPLVVLQRLANPNQAAQENPNQPNYNPYVTVDYWEVLQGQIWDGRAYTTTGDNASRDEQADRASFARLHPLAALDAINQRVKTVIDPASATSPQTSWFRQNSIKNDPAELAPLQTPFEWLTHLDRMPINGAEVVHTSALRPYDVLRYFRINNESQKHLAPWKDSTARIYRFLEFVSTSSDPYRYDTQNDPGSPTNNPVRPGFWGRPNSRIAGKINLNTVMHPEVIKALADANGGNIFTEQEVLTAFNGLFTRRTPGGNKAWATDILLEPSNDSTRVDKPFLGFGVGEVMPISLDQSIAANKHPYQKMELLTKIFNHITTRSNCFAIWMTVGFFEVVDENALPPRLGAEIGKAENRQIRHRMFAIVDRTQMKAFETVAGANIPNPATTPLPAQQPINLNGQQGPTVSIQDPRTGRTWMVTEGTVLVYDPGEDNEEAVVVRRDASNNLVADFGRYHAQGCRVICHGNPGPMTRYDPRKDTDVVPYFLLID